MKPSEPTTSLLHSLEHQPFGDLLSAIRDDRGARQALVGLAVAAEALVDAGLDPDKLENALGILGRSQDFLSVGIWYHVDQDRYEVLSRWRSVDDEVPSTLNIADWDLQWLHEAMSRGEIAEVWRGQSERTNLILDRFGDESILLVPISGSDGYWGVAMFAQPRGRQDPWGPQARSCLRTFAAILGSSLRKCQQKRQADRLRVALEAVRREEGLATLAAGVAHDLSNLLSIVRAGVELGTARNEIQPKLAARLDRTVDSATGMVDQLYAFAGLKAQCIRAIDMRRLVTAGYQLFGPMVPPGVNVDITIPPDAPRVLGDLTQVAQIIGNVALNGCEACAESGGTVVLGAHPEERDVPGLLIWVQDDGPGVPESLRSSLFAPLASSKGARRGLGLTCAMSLTRAHRGTLRHVPKSGPGARFEVWLPTAVDEGLP